MKKINKITIAVFAMVSSMTMISCMDNQNEWEANPSLIKQMPPSSLSMESDSASLKTKLTIEGIEYKKSPTVEVQISKSPLSCNAELPVEGDIYTFSTEVTPEMVEASDNVITGNTVKLIWSIDRENSQFTITENTTYYLRARLVSKDGSKSNWFTNGMYYSGDATDEKMAQRFIRNTYNSYTTPSILWINTGDVKDESITVNWHNIKYATPKTLRNETLNEQVDISGVPSDASKTPVYSYKWSDLTVNTPYTFSLLDENGNVLSSATKTTEYLPNMSHAMSITVVDDDFDNVRFKQKGNPYTITSKEVDGKTFTITFNNESSHGWTTSRNDWVANPLEQAINFNIRGQLKANTSAVVEVPCNGRLYIYGYNPTTITVTQEDNDGNITLEERIQTKTEKTKIPMADDASKTQNAYRSYYTRLTQGKATIEIGSAAFYFYGMCFVPDGN